MPSLKMKNGGYTGFARRHSSVMSTVVENSNDEGEDIVQAYVDKIPVRAQDDTSPIILGSGSFTYRLENAWAKLPSGWKLRDVTAVAADKDDRVYVFSRSEQPMMVFDRDGNFLTHWGKGTFKRPHGIHIGPDGMLYLVDDGDHTVRKCTPEGKVLLVIGIPNKPTPFMSGDPFCRCTDVALSPKGEIYVSDGYCNARVHKYSPDGKLLLSWGAPGADIGEFNIPHNIVCDDRGWVYVADRENHRVQIFDGNGRYEAQWTNMHRASALEQHERGDKLFYLGEIASHLRANRHVPNLGPRISILNGEGKALARLGVLPPGNAPDRFMSPHGLAIDSRGDIYVGEVAYHAWGNAYPGIDVPEHLNCLRKLVKVSAPSSS
jgi:DNA-binding beta-propeller fold protein YncE